MIIIVDDERTFVGLPTPNIYCRTSSAALDTLVRVWTNQWMGYADPIQELWLDHDLGENDDITPVVQFLYLISYTDKPLRVNQIFVHSQNASGARSMVGVLKNRYPFVMRSELPNVLV